MIYQGKELEPITEPQMFVPPKKMLVWDKDDEVFKRNVFCIVKTKNGDTRVVIETYTSVGVSVYMHCAKIPEEPKPRLATYLEFSRWLAHGNGQVHTDSCGGRTDTAVLYDDDCDDTEVRGGLKARKWCDKEWHEPTIDYLVIKED